MNRTELKAEIENTARESESTPVEIISAMQSVCAETNEEMMEALADIKWDYITL